MLPSDVPELFSLERVKRNRARTLEAFGDYNFLHQRVNRDLAERLADASGCFSDAVEIGPRDGALAEAISDNPQVKTIRSVDTADALPPHSVDLIVSALWLHWVNDVPGELTRLRQALKPDRLFIGALFGAGALRELRECLAQAELEIRDGAALRVSPLPGLQDMAGLLQRAGFALPVVDRDQVIVRYDTPFHLIDDIRGMGEAAAFADGGRPPLSRRILNRMADLYAEKFSDPDGRLRATFEIIHVSGWSPGPQEPKAKRPGSAKVRLADALGAAEIPAGDKVRK